MLSCTDSQIQLFFVTDILDIVYRVKLKNHLVDLVCLWSRLPLSNGLSKDDSPLLSFNLKAKVTPVSKI